MLDVGQWQGEMWNARQSGDEYLLALSVTALKDEAGAHRGLLIIFSDITERTRREEAMQRQEQIFLEELKRDAVIDRRL